MGLQEAREDTFRVRSVSDLPAIEAAAASTFSVERVTFATMGSSITKLAIAAATVQFGIVSAFAPAMRSLSRNTVAVGARVRRRSPQHPLARALPRAQKRCSLTRSPPSPTPDSRARSPAAGRAWWRRRRAARPRSAGRSATSRAAPRSARLPSAARSATSRAAPCRAAAAARRGATAACRQSWRRLRSSRELAFFRAQPLYCGLLDRYEEAMSRHAGFGGAAQRRSPTRGREATRA